MCVFRHRYIQWSPGGEAFPDDKNNSIKGDAGQKVALYQIAIFKSIVDGIGMWPADLYCASC